MGGAAKQGLGVGVGLPVLRHSPCAPAPVSCASAQPPAPKMAKNDDLTTGFRSKVGLLHATTRKSPGRVLNFREPRVVCPRFRLLFVVRSSFLATLYARVARGCARCPMHERDAQGETAKAPAASIQRGACAMPQAPVRPAFSLKVGAGGAGA